MTKTEKVKIVWNGQGGELDSVTITVKTEYSVRNALVHMLAGNIVSPGDSFTVEEIA